MQLHSHPNIRGSLLMAEAMAAFAMNDTFALFPNLGERQDNPAGVLSGGEQQMLTMCRTLMGDPDLVIIDEPSRGLRQSWSSRSTPCSTRSRGAVPPSCWSSRS
jgi:ABC-type branched-subunit amino acid transport system ATPase component